MIAILIDTLSWISIVLGVVLLISGGIGLLRLPDFFTRCHAAGITDTGATMLIIVGLMLQAGPTMVTIKLGFILLFLFFTSPTATHALAHAAAISGLNSGALIDQTKEHREPKS